MSKVTGIFEKLGLVKSVEATPSYEPAAAEDVTPTSLAQEAPQVTVAAIPPERFEGGSSDIGVSIEDIYAKAGVAAPPHGFTVYKLIELIGAEEFKGMDSATLAKVISGTLKRLPGGVVPVEDIVKDAAARDAALDSFERFLTSKLARHEEEIAKENIALQAEIDRVYQENNAKMGQNKTMIQEEKMALEAWRRKKEEEESRLYEALRPFVTENPITRGSAAAQQPQGAR